MKGFKKVQFGCKCLKLSWLCLVLSVMNISKNTRGQTLEAQKTRTTGMNLLQNYYQCKTTYSKQIYNRDSACPLHSKEYSAFLRAAMHLNQCNKSFTLSIG